MQIDSVLPNQAPTGQSVIVQGEELDTTEKVFVGDEEASFDVDGKVLVVQVPDGAGTADVTVEGADGESDAAGFTIME